MLSTKVNVRGLTDESLNSRVAEILGWRFGSRDECAPKYEESFEACWWFEGLPRNADEVPQFLNPKMVVYFQRQLMRKFNLKEALGSIVARALLIQADCGVFVHDGWLLARATAEVWLEEKIHGDELGGKDALG